jgi:hypothetical protein
MTDQPTTPAEDELVSAVLDGDATEEERSRVLADPHLHARLAEFERVRAALNDVAVDGAAREAAITDALDDATGPGAARPGAPRHPDLVDLERERRRRRLAAIVAVAAAVLVFVPVLAIALTGRGTETADRTASAPQSESSDESVPFVGEPATGPSAALVYIGDLGPLGAGAELPASVQAKLEERRSMFSASGSLPPTSTVGPQADAGNQRLASSPLEACAASILTAEPDLGGLVASATGSTDATVALVYVFRPVATTDGTVVVTGPDCQPVARFAL